MKTGLLHFGLEALVASLFITFWLGQRVEAGPREQECLAVRSQIEEHSLFPKFENLCNKKVNVLYCCVGDDVNDCTSQGWAATEVKVGAKESFYGCKDMAKLAFDGCFDPQWPLSKGAKVIGTRMAAPCSKLTMYRPETVAVVAKPDKLRAKDKVIVKKIGKNSTSTRQTEQSGGRAGTAAQSKCANPYGGPSVRSGKFLCMNQGFIWACQCSGGRCSLMNTGSQLCTQPGALID